MNKLIDIEESLLCLRGLRAGQGLGLLTADFHGLTRIKFKDKVKVKGWD